MSTMALLTGTSRVQGKLRVLVSTHQWGSYLSTDAELEAELPGKLVSSDRTGPVAVLQEVLEQLARPPFDKPAVQGQALVAAAVIRTLQAIPGADVSQKRHGRYASQLELIPAGGHYEISKASADTFRVSYRAKSLQR